MTEAEFFEFWHDPGKCLTDDITFSPCQDHPDSLCFEKLVVTCQSDLEVLLNGHYNCDTGAITFNFSVPGVGAITRYDAGGPVHRDAGRFHIHIPESEEDFRRHLPNAVPRPDLEGKTPEQVWGVVCEEAQVAHTGDFYPPEVLCR